MSNISTYLADKLLDHAFGEGSYTEPTCYAALFTTTPTMPAGTGGVEVTGGSYARVALTGLMGAASAGQIQNSSDVTWTTATASWGTVAGVGIYDASSAGNLLMAGPLSSSVPVASGQTFSFPAADLIGALA